MTESLWEISVLINKGTGTSSAQKLLAKILSIRYNVYSLNELSSDNIQTGISANVSAIIYETDETDSDESLLIKKISEMTDAPLIVISHKNDSQKDEYYIAAGADDFLTVSNSDKLLLSTIRKSILRRQVSVNKSGPVKITSALFNQNIAGVGLFDSYTGRFLKINHRYCEIIGYNENELLNTDFMNITHPDDLNEDLGMMGKLRAGEIRSFTLEKRYFRKDGKIIWVNLTVSEAVREGPMLLSHIAIIYDITFAIEAGQKLKNTEKHYRSLIENAPDGILLLNEQGMMTYASPGARKIFGYKDEDPSVISPSEQIHPDDLTARISDTQYCNH